MAGGSNKRVFVELLGSSSGAVRAFEATALAAEESSAKMGSKFEEGGKKVEGIFSKLGNTLSNWGLPFGEAVSKMGSKFGELETKGQKLNGIMSEVGKATVLGGVAAFAALGAVGIKAASSFDTLGERLVTTAGESQKALGSVKAGMLALSISTATSANTLATAMYTVESAGFHGASGLNVLKAAAQGAKAEGADTSTVADALTSALNAYGLSGKEAIPVTNEMLAAVSKGKMNFEDFASSLSNVLPVAAAAHLSFSQVGGAVATMTAQGMSAQQATQDLANTIRSLQAPNAVAIGEMQQLGLNSNKVSKSLGKVGLTGTLAELTKAITDHMGPSGEVIMNAFNESQSAGQDLQIMLKAMPPNVRTLADEFMNGSMSMSAFRRAIPTNETGLIGQFTALYAKAHGFNTLLKSGLPAAQTYTAALSKMTGGATGLNTALLLSGGHAATFAENVKAVGEASRKAGSNIEDWSVIQHEFSFQTKQVREALEAVAIKVGDMLIPVLQKVMSVVSDVVGWFEKHKAAAIALGGVITGVLGAAIAVYAVNTGVKMVRATQSAVSSIGSLVTKLAGQRAAQMETGLSSEEMSTTMAESDAAIQRSQMLLEANTQSLGTEMDTWLSSIGASSSEMAATMEASGASSEAALAGIGTAEESLATTAEAAGPEVSAGLGPIGLAITGIGLAASLLASHWKVIWKDVRAIAIDAWHFLDSDVVQPLKRGWDALWGSVKTIAIDAWHFLLNTVFLPWKIEFDLIRDALTFLGTHWSEIWNGIKKVASDIWHFLDNTFFHPIMTALDGIKSAIDAVSGAFSKISGLASSIGHGIGGAISGIGHVFGLATGGIVTKPTLAVVGEAGPEMVIPLAKLGNFQPGGPAPAPLPANIGAQTAQAGGSSAPVVQPTYYFSVAASIDNPQTRAQLQQMIDESHQRLAALIENGIH